jgi:hypothetical protein
MWIFNGMIYSAALKAFFIYTENVPHFGEHKKEKRQKFLKELALALIVPHARQNLEEQQTPQDMKQVIRSCGILPEVTSTAPSTTQRHSVQSKRYYICHRPKYKKNTFICNECKNFVRRAQQMVVQPMTGVKFRPTDNTFSTVGPN